ncbi:MAG: arginase family protein, partial [Rhizobiales bacterium]|nr:arginase family protein [Hyphomicrobiales bacterium]
MKLALISAPYDSGHHRSGFGLGPNAILAGGLADTLQSHHHDVAVQDIGKVGDAQEREIATGFAVCRAVASMVRAARDDGRFPIVLAGNCLTSVGATAGEAADSIIWFDQHGDLNTPETSIHGFLDGMALATVLGLCWRPLADAIPGFNAIDPARCLLADARDLDPAEKMLLKRLPITHVRWEDAFETAKKLKASRTHLHLDLDVHDPSALQANRYAEPGGPSPAQLRQTVCNIATTVPLTGVTITAYDPAY